jgi:hypothetical protein
MVEEIARRLAHLVELSLSKVSGWGVMVGIFGGQHSRRLPVNLAKPGLQGGILHDDENPVLCAAARGRPDRGIKHPRNHFVGNRFRLETTQRSRRTDRIEH